MNKLNTIIGFKISYPSSKHSIWTLVYPTTDNNSMTTPLLSSEEKEEVGDTFVCKNHDDIQTYWFDDIEQAKHALSSDIVDCEDGPFQGVVDIGPNMVRVYIDMIHRGKAICGGRVSADMECIYLHQKKDESSPNYDEEDHTDKILGFSTRHQIEINMMHDSVKKYSKLSHSIST
jgi:hypothetical protein